jgi:GR25 family glycosyltransferase involved in LPS biosynthesis
MKKNPERLEFMTRQLRKMGIDFEIQEGVGGATYDFSDIYDKDISKKLNGTPLAPVEKGCALSHRLIFEKIIKENLDYALIMEDDVELPVDFKRIIDREIENRELNKTQWEYLSFNYPSVGIKFIRLWLFLLSEKFRKNTSYEMYVKIPIYFLKFIGIAGMSCLEGMRDAIYRKYRAYSKPALFYRPIYLAGCYLINKNGVQKLLSVNNKLVYPADRIQNVARVQKGLRLYWYVPLIVKQRRDRFESTMYQNKRYVYEKYD